ncbi:MAG: hypothetical protein L3V56_00170 [Candidatus Magnetoovum sp. WYHC-5]|nr:hypothetical protein [Candidatus Magnetoovum sp. WYHC-5]
MKKFLPAVLICLMLIASACDTPQGRGAGAGAAIGGVAGALLANDPLTGAIIGSGLGAAFGFVAGDIADRSAKQAALENRTVEYRSTDGTDYYKAEPTGQYYFRDEERGTLRCRKIRERIWEDGRLVQNREREVCESNWTEHR